MKNRHLTLIAISIIAATLSHAPAQTIPGEIAEAPPTTRKKVENIQVRHDRAIADLQALFGRISKDATLISSHEAIDAIDQADRELKNTKSAIATVVASLRSESKTISNEVSFSDEQKTELVAAIDAMIAKCDELTSRTTIAINHLQGTYKEMPKWRKVYRAYLNLDGEAKALEQLKNSVDEFAKGLTAEPGAFDAAPVKSTDEEKTE